MALSKYGNIEYYNYNYGCPMVGNEDFANIYDAQPREKQTPTLRVRNINDIVPDLPRSGEGYRQVGQEYLIDFHAKYADPNPACRLLDNHMAQNYAPVLLCASTSSNGVCVNDNVAVPWPTCA